MKQILIVGIFLLLPIILKAQATQKKVADTSIHITINANKVYNNGNYTGRYTEKTIAGELTFLKIYGNGSAEIAEATHAEGEGNWTVVTPVDQNKVHIPYSDKEPMQQLFKYLIAMKYL